MSRRMMLAAASEWMSATIENRLMVHARFPSTGSNTFHHFSSFRNFVPPLAHFVIAFLALAALVRTSLGPLLPINSLLPDFPTRAKPSCLLQLSTSRYLSLFCLFVLGPGSPLGQPKIMIVQHIVSIQISNCRIVFLHPKKRKKSKIIL